MNDVNLLEDQPIAWTPTPEVIERAQITRFMNQIGVLTWDELYQYSIADVERFTQDVLEFLDIKFDPPYEKLLYTSDGIEFPTWFATGSSRRGRGDEEGSVPRAVATGAVSLGVAEDALTVSHAGLNITKMCLDRWLTDGAKDQPAVIWEGEEGGTVTLSYAQLKANVDVCVEKLLGLEIGKGDAVGMHLPMLPETVVALLAINRVGAIAVPVFSGYGIDAISSRMEAVGAKALFTSDGFPRRGKAFDMLTVAARAIANVASIESVIIVERNYYVGTSAPERDDVIDSRELRQLQIKRYEYLRHDVFSGRRIALWGVGAGDLAEESVAAKTSAEDPLIILYTSGTTGKPKGIAHTHASFPIKAAQDMAFGSDVGKGTRISWYTDIGWMMGPWLIYGALINGATICIYDGAPDYPNPDRMWEFCAKHGVEILGISPTLIRALSNSGDDLPKAHDLSSLRAFASTGEPWNPAPWWWLFEKVGDSKLPIINYSGGTEISGGILMGNMLLPQKPCSFPAPCPGMDVDIVDEEGKSVGPGEVGELVIKQPWIGMARGFWQERERYLETYWSRFKNIWVHGDWAMRDTDGHWFILGRSDDTLKVAGKRVGPAEVESILVSHPNVTEAAVIGVPDAAKGTAMVAFCVLSEISPQRRRDAEANKNPATTDSQEGGLAPALAAELKALVARDMGKPLAPSKVHFVTALPKTRNAKVMRRVIRSAYLGEDPGDLSALENPQTVHEIQNAKP